MNNVILYCRPGFEKECAAEITEKAAAREIFGFARVKDNSGYVVFVCYQHEEADRLVRVLPLRAALRAQRILKGEEHRSPQVIHVLFIAPGCCYAGYSYRDNHSPFYMGIPRLRFPPDATSRSTLKLEEAFHVFIPADEWDERLNRTGNPPHWSSGDARFQQLRPKPRG